MLLIVGIKERISRLLEPEEVEKEPGQFKNLANTEALAGSVRKVCAS